MGGFIWRYTIAFVKGVYGKRPRMGATLKHLLWGEGGYGVGRLRLFTFKVLTWAVAEHLASTLFKQVFQSRPRYRGLAMRAILDRTIFLLLLCFFLSRVVISLMKMEEAKVGISQTKIRSSTVQYPSISLCFKTSDDVSVSMLASGESNQVMNITEKLMAISFGGIVNDRWESMQQ